MLHFRCCNTSRFGCNKNRGVKMFLALCQMCYDISCNFRLFLTNFTAYLKVSQFILRFSSIFLCKKLQSLCFCSTSDMFEFKGKTYLLSIFNVLFLFHTIHGLPSHYQKCDEIELNNEKHHLMYSKLKLDVVSQMRSRMIWMTPLFFNVDLKQGGS